MKSPVPTATTPVQNLAKVVSFIFHPLILPTYTFLLTWWTNPLLFSNYGGSEMSKIFLTVFINTFIFPVVTIILVWRLGFVKSLYMDSPKERIVPYFAIGLFYIWTYVVFRKSGLPQILNIVILGATITLFATFLANLFRKVSIHTGAMGCMMIITLFLCILSGGNYNALMLLVVMIAGLTGSSRLVLDVHTPGEVFFGYFIGVMSQLIAFNFY